MLCCLHFLPWNLAEAPQRRPFGNSCLQRTYKAASREVVLLSG